MTQRRSGTGPAVVSRALCGRAHLARALACADENLLAGIAARLGFEPYGEPPSPPFRTGKEPCGETGGQRRRTGTGTRPAPRNRPAARDSLLGSSWNESSRRDRRASWMTRDSTALPAWTRRPPVLATARPLATWRELLPRSRCALTEQAETHALGPARPCASTQSRGRAWNGCLGNDAEDGGYRSHLIEDRGDHLAPYWDDQERVREYLVRLFPHYAVAHALWFEGLSAPVWADGERSAGPYRPPPRAVWWSCSAIWAVWREAARPCAATGWRWVNVSPRPAAARGADARARRVSGTAAALLDAAALGTLGGRCRSRNTPGPGATAHHLGIAGAAR